MAFVTVDISAGRFPLIEVFRHFVRNSGMAGIVQVFGCLHDGAIHTRQQQASEKRRGTKSRGARHYGGSNLTAGYGDLEGAPVTVSAQHIGASACFGRFWSRNGCRGGRKAVCRCAWRRF